eukprot:10484143-Prorocentrum_lima.AAC.1
MVAFLGTPACGAVWQLSRVAHVHHLPQRAGWTWTRMPGRGSSLDSRPPYLLPTTRCRGSRPRPF